MAKDPPDNDDDTPRELAEPAERDPQPFGVARVNFDQRVVSAMTAAQQYGESIALLLIDLDYFGKFNQQYGRLAGDAALAAIYRRIVSSIGASDLVTPFGDDDFAVLCRSSVGSYGPILAQRLWSRISNGAVEIQGVDDAYFFTVCVGVCLFPGPGVSTYIDFVTRAEDALRRAKAAGRNRVVIVNDPQDRDELSR